MAQEAIYYKGPDGSFVPVGPSHPLPITLAGLQDDLDLYIPLLMLAAVNGVASLDGTGKVPDGQIPSAIARDAEVTTAIDNLRNQLLNGAGPAVDTLKELGDLLAADESIAAALATTVAGKAPLASQLKATSVKTATYAAVPGDEVPLNTAGGTIALTLPTAPADGAIVAGKWTVGVIPPTVATGGADVLNLAGGVTGFTWGPLNTVYTFRYRATGAIWYVETSFSKGGLDSLYSAKASVRPIIIERSSGDLALAVSAVFVDSDTTGTAAARTLDLVFPGAVVGDAITVEPNFYILSSTGTTVHTFATIVAGAVVHRAGGALGISTWSTVASTVGKITGAFTYVVQAGDIEAGAVRVRLQHISSGAARTVKADANTKFYLEGRGPFG